MHNYTCIKNAKFWFATRGVPFQFTFHRLSASDVHRKSHFKNLRLTYSPRTSIVLNGQHVGKVGKVTVEARRKEGGIVSSAMFHDLVVDGWIIAHRPG